MADRRGKQYQCVHCESIGKKYVGPKYRVEGHIYKHHLALDKAPFYCSLCLLRCTTRAALQNHVTRHDRHKLILAQTGFKDESRFLIENPTPIILTLGKDFKEVTAPTGPEPQPQPIDQNSTTRISTTTQAPNALAFQTIVQSQQMSSNGMFNLQLTPEALFKFLNSQEVKQPSEVANPTAPVQTYSPIPPRAMPIYKPTPLQNNIQLPSTSLMNTPKPSTQTQPPPTPAASLESASFSSLFGTPSPLEQQPQQNHNTQTETLLNLLATDTISELDYALDDFQTEEPIPAITVPIQSSERTNDASIQTEQPQEEPPTKKPRLEETILSTIEKIVEKAFDKFAQAMEQNSRAIRGVDKTLQTLTDVTTRMARTMERMGEERRRENLRREEEGRRSEKEEGRRSEKEEGRRSEKEETKKRGKENTLKSVVIRK